LGEDIYDVELFKRLNNMMAGGGFYGPDSTLQKSTNKGLEVVNSILSDIMG
jgi:hypothetical protein